VGSMGQGAARGSLVGGAGVLCYLELSSVCRFWQQPERWEGRSMGCTRGRFLFLAPFPQTSKRKEPVVFDSDVMGLFHFASPFPFIKGIDQDQTPL
jgi:hypothetical protein